MPVSSVTEHWIKQDAVTINLNHFGDPDYLQVSVLAGAVVMAFKQDVIGYNAAHNYRTWPLEAANTYLETTSAVNVYAKLTRSEVNARALIAYDTVLRDIEGREITYAEDGSEILGESNPELYYVFLGQISGSIDNNGEQIERNWEVSFRFGNLDTSQYRNEEAGGEWMKMFHLNKVTDMIDVLKTFSSATFKRLFIGEKEIGNIQRSTDHLDIDDNVIPTTKYTEESYLSKKKDDHTPHSLSVGKNLEVDGTLYAERVQSDDFVQGSLMGSGWSVYKDANGNTVVETDTVIARKGINASELVVNQETFEKGSNIFVKGGCTIVKVEEVDGKYRCFYDNENGKRFSGFKVGDQARCQRYDSSYWLKIKYYWRLVVGVADDYVELSMTDFDGDGVPEEGDDIAQLGNRTDKTRQSAIVISPDNGGSVVVWAGIDSYNLSERNMCGMGVNPNNGRAYIYGYGDMFFGDRNLEKNFITYQIKDGDTEPTLTINADVHLSKDSTGLGNLTEFEEIKTNVDYLNNQIEREFTIWYFDDEPTLENEPAVNWVTDELKAMHDQDLYFSDALARAWRFVNGKWVEVTDERTLAALKLADEAQKAATEAKDYINNVLPKQLEGLQNQIDGTIESYFYKYDPSLDNYPANEWITEEQKETHLNDTFTNLESGYSWRWTKGIIPSEEEGVEPSVLYKWIEIADTATVKALVAAGKAQDTADGKRRVFVETPFTPYNVGDLWVQGEAGDIMRCAVERLRGEYAESDWVKASKYTDDSALETFLNGAYKNQLEVIQKQIDSRSETWYQVKDPSLSWDTDELKQLHFGDLWYSINDKQSFMWTGTEWIVQGVPDEVFDKIDGKAEIFVSKPTKYNRNDLWFLGEDITLDKAYKAGVIVVATAKSNVFNPIHWTKFDKYTDDTLAQEALKKAESFSDDLSGVLADMEIVKGQVDREFTIWYYDAEPTLCNEPAVNWNTQALIEMHDQDIYFSDSLARAWRFVEGRWVEITDERTLAVLNKVSDLEFIKEAFGKNVMQGGILISDLVSVQNDDGEIEAFLNGGNFAKDDTNGKLILAGGIPSLTTSGSKYLEKRAKEAKTRIYEDGTLVAENATIKGEVNATSGTFNNVSFQSGHIGGFRVSGSGIINQIGESSFDNDAYIRLKNTSEDTEAAIGGNVVPPSTGRKLLARFVNENDKLSQYSSLPNECFEIGAKGAIDNVALSIDGGCIEGLAYRTYTVSSNSTSNIPKNVTEVLCTNTQIINVYLPSLDVYDDGHVVRVTRTGSEFWLYPFDCNTLNSYEPVYGRTLIYHEGNYYSYSNPISIQSWHTCELVWHRDFSKTINGVKYRGLWILTA